MYLVIFCYWVGPVPYLELFGVGPVEKNTLYIKSKHNPNDFPDRCINQRGSYTCLCESGFAFDSTNTTCLPIDLCLTGDHGRSFTIDTFEKM